MACDNYRINENMMMMMSFTGDLLSPLLLSVDTLFSRLVDSQPISDDVMICMDSIYNETVVTHPILSRS